MATNGKKKRITALGVEVSNFHRLSVAEVKHVPGKGLVRVTGKNRAGKSTVLDAIASTLAGAGAVRQMPVRVGTEEGEASLTRLTLTNGFTLTRRYPPSNPKGYLTVEGPDGGKHGQGKLDGWAGPLSFDPLAFFGLKPERQCEIVLSLGSDPELPGKLTAIRRERAEKYSERTPWISQKRKAAAAVAMKPAGERPVPVDVSAEMRRMGELQKVERERADLVRGRERERDSARARADQAIVAAERVAEDAERARKQAVNQVESYGREIAELRAQLATLEAEEQAAISQVVRASALAGDALAIIRTLLDPDEATAAIPDPELPADPAEEMDAVRARIEAADEVLAKIEPWKAHDRAHAELEEATRAVDALTDVMGQLEVREQALVHSAGIPLPGVTFGDDGAILLNGLPLELASGAERIDLAVRVAIEVDPELGIVLIDEANDVDLEGLAVLHELAVEHGFQLWVARVGLEGQGEVVVEDGVAMDRESAVPAGAES